METDTLYRQLQQHLDRMPIPFPATESGVEIRILRQIFTPEEAALTLQASAIPEPAAAIHRRIKPAVPLADVVSQLDQMAAKGIILRFPAPGGPLYAKMMFAVGFYERQLKRLTPELERDCREYILGAYGRALANKKTPQLRTVPVNKTIAIERNVATYDDIRSHVEAHRGPFAAMDCICRTGKEVTGGKCLQTSLKGNCLTLGVAARAMVRARPFTSVDDLALRVPALNRKDLVSLAQIGALNSIGEVEHLRDALWQVEEAARAVGPFSGKSALGRAHRAGRLWRRRELGARPRAPCPRPWRHRLCGSTPRLGCRGRRGFVASKKIPRFPPTGGPWEHRGDRAIPP